MKQPKRSKDNGVLGGVISGLLEYLNLNTLILRFLFIAMWVAGLTPIFLLYIIA